MQNFAGRLMSVLLAGGYI